MHVPGGKVDSKIISAPFFIFFEIWLQSSRKLTLESFLITSNPTLTRITSESLVSFMFVVMEISLRFAELLKSFLNFLSNESIQFFLL